MSKPKKQCTKSCEPKCIKVGKDQNSKSVARNITKVSPILSKTPTKEGSLKRCATEFTGLPTETTLNPSENDMTGHGNMFDSISSKRGYPESNPTQTTIICSSLPSPISDTTPTPSNHPHFLSANNERSSAILCVEHDMVARLPTSTFISGKVTHVYSPLNYAGATHADFVRRCCSVGGSGDSVPYLLVGMNPGPWGMSQNGVPFGEMDAVRQWLHVRGEVTTPADQHPQRPVTGLHCTRSEVSGRRFWSLWRRLCGSPDRFFRHAFVYNFCPLAFMERSGRNVTPNCLSRPLQRHIEAACGPALAQIVQILGARTVIGVGKYAETQARRALAAAGLSHVSVFPLLHPSPINPQANKDWEGVATKQLADAGLLPLLTQSAECDVTESAPND